MGNLRHADGGGGREPGGRERKRGFPRPAGRLARFAPHFLHVEATDDDSGRMRDRRTRFRGVDVLAVTAAGADDCRTRGAPGGDVAADPAHPRPAQEMDGRVSGKNVDRFIGELGPRGCRGRRGRSRGQLVGCGERGVVGVAGRGTDGTWSGRRRQAGDYALAMVSSAARAADSSASFFDVPQPVPSRRSRRKTDTAYSRAWSAPSTRTTS